MFATMGGSKYLLIKVRFSSHLNLFWCMISDNVCKFFPLSLLRLSSLINFVTYEIIDIQHENTYNSLLQQNYTLWHRMLEMFNIHSSL